MKQKDNIMAVSNQEKPIPLLDGIIYNPNARGIWCACQYPGHPKGCPNLKKGCISTRPDFLKIKNVYDWFAVIEKFDLTGHAKMMKQKHSAWSDRQCRNPLYWQGSVRKRLRMKAELAAGKINESGQSFENDNVILDIPEACGIDMFKTMENVGIKLERHPETVIKIMIIGMIKNV